MAIKNGEGGLKAKATLSASGLKVRFGSGHLSVKAVLGAVGGKTEPVISQTFDLSGTIFYNLEE